MGLCNGVRFPSCALTTKHPSVTYDSFRYRTAMQAFSWQSVQSMPPRHTHTAPSRAYLQCPLFIRETRGSAVSTTNKNCGTKTAGNCTAWPRLTFSSKRIQWDIRPFNDMGAHGFPTLAPLSKYPSVLLGFPILSKFNFKLVAFNYFVLCSKVGFFEITACSCKEARCIVSSL